MRIVVLGHPQYFGSHSMNRFAAMVAQGMADRGHEVFLWSPEPMLQRLAIGRASRKWLGYLDQYLLFPLLVRWRLRGDRAGTLVVLADHALAMWLHFLRGYPHAIHSHDFTPLRALAGELPQMELSRAATRVYQRMIRASLGLGRYFIAVSHQTARDLGRFHGGSPFQCSVVYNGLNYPYCPLDAATAVERLRSAGHTAIGTGALLHVGGNDWYKNRRGVLAMYIAYCRMSHQDQPIRPLWMIGAPPTDALRALGAQAEAAGGQVHWLSGLDTGCVHAAYALASVLLFPSQAEGFGWPIIEAMACGTPVLTVDRDPMREVAGGVAQLVPPMDDADVEGWAARCAPTLAAMLEWSAEERAQVVQQSLQHAARFSAEQALDQYERLYQVALRSGVATSHASAST
ncbi:glycosyltransferase [Cupriavidus sp. BIS7]|uniref:glycosyltransferase n=1 Tax=Cupriavidus sp. BIS7 TaxID=1217718 RepID=UPI0003174372|nr:glycosyltransferase [Cupriavidus sp. BIS7]